MSIAKTLKRWLNKPLFGTRVIPKDAVVDATAFSEDEYPVHCTKCGYLLRGLEDGLCPECGTFFERGRLLVVQYFQSWKGPAWRDSATGRWSQRLATMGTVLIIAGALGVLGLKWASPTVQLSLTQAGSRNYVVIAFLGTFAIGYITLMISGLLTARTYPPDAKKKRRAIKTAIFDPSHKG